MTDLTNKPLFSLGQIVATPGAIEVLTELNLLALTFLHRHVTGDWGDVCKEDAASNDAAVTDENRILSSYKLTETVKIWIITEWDRSVTTILLPSEY
jgi:hypothetical protein